MLEALTNLTIKIAPAVITPTAATAPTQDALFLIIPIILRKINAKLVNFIYVAINHVCLYQFVVADGCVACVIVVVAEANVGNF